MNGLHLDAKLSIARTSIAAWNALMRADPIFGRYALSDAGQSTFLAAFTVVNDGEWRVAGKLHRVGAPARTWSDGDEWWYEYGRCHRIDGPAITYADGDKEWWVYGVSHRADMDLAQNSADCVIRARNTVGATNIPCTRALIRTPKNGARPTMRSGPKNNTRVVTHLRAHSTGTFESPNATPNNMAAVACDRCGKMMRADNLARHLAKRVPCAPVVHQCDRCDRVFSTKSNLTRHRHNMCQRAPQIAAVDRADLAIAPIEIAALQQLPARKPGLMSSIIAGCDWPPHVMSQIWLPCEPPIEPWLHRAPPPHQPIVDEPRKQRRHPNCIYFIRTAASVKTPTASKIHVKIGRSVNPAKRLATLQTGCPHRLSLLVTIATADLIAAAGLEARLHLIHSAKRIGGEWFEFTQTELDQAVDDAWALVLGDADDSS